MRGEHIECLVEDGRHVGSSPHARGTPALRVGVGRPDGIIPACAGNTIRPTKNGSPSGDHPRMRGEHSNPYIHEFQVEGSSPHARGTQTQLEPLEVFAGIIPACAGNTRHIHRNRAHQWDHPRMRGEHIEIAIGELDKQGSSPHARGTRAGAVGNDAAVGIIPACAGNTRSPPTICGRTWDHPRMRGEHWNDLNATGYSWGSSPHARGTPSIFPNIKPRIGIIPACAGNTLRTDRLKCPSRDHPRMRGEHRLSHFSLSQMGGSSPHARGTPVHAQPDDLGEGIIPACAGNTASPTRRRSSRRDHPRMRGEHCMTMSERYEVSGSSPHARGTLLHAYDRRVDDGIIPACAGNTLNELALYSKTFIVSIGFRFAIA